ncbi:hypothetical protein METBIDRAFT_33507 [Metschnikowia bicuspidata var. bicuspidata NRRL YB-4993]|uniref:Homeobox domain-containing protein n=1 Tax=Metschnikowia bicuspidata var. bicuspidata NRRL YB-4993 TaxID=869754 RepID=A0A1A0H5F8_9ASCO|nr:hypothetical protein METBIDRAFT_33507 [Metschnikowia bicuspidata var. bicuspidata NRRL YB-4993]OBA19324.1 hypothetical protein METBIDRAFT_33507 [Metschnikowia bicuspidata var. bicuspidata NRRL YB-4993]
MSDDTNLKRSRASGEVLDYLLREFDVNQNPNPDQRKDISERTGMTEKAVRIWFQNRRAKLRKFERMGKPVKQSGRPGVSPRGVVSGPSSRSNLLTNVSLSALDQHSETPNELNDKYCFIDCSSLSVGSWQRIKSGQHDHHALKTSLINLSPFTLDQFMNTVDLMVILSKKNNEINYFFAAISNNSKILFRIFYPISSIISSSLLENSVSKESSELRLKLSHTPKFSVYFFSGINANLNQWSICDDFSEAQQVSSAYYAPGGTSTPHVLVGSKLSLEFLLEFVKTQNEHQIPGFESVALHHFEHDPKDSHLDASNVNAFDPVHATETKGQYTLSHNSHDANDFSIKHDVDWHDTPRDEQDFAMKGISPLGDFHNRSQSPAMSQHSSLNTDIKYLTGLSTKESENAGHSSKKPENEYSDIFTDSPDFFNAVQTPGTHQTPSHTSIRDHDNLINSPSTNVHSFVNDNVNTDNISNSRSDKDHQVNLRESSALSYSAPQFNSSIEQHKYGYDDGTSHPHDYGFAAQIPANEFLAHEILSGNQSMPNDTSNSGATTQTAHEDQFIDYNGDA